MKTYHCPKCNRDLDFAIPQLFGAHQRTCKNGNQAEVKRSVGRSRKDAPPVAPHDPLSYLDLAITEIDVRSSEIRAELQGRAILEAELDALQIKREYIIAAKTQIGKRTQPQDTESAVEVA